MSMSTISTDKARSRSTSPTPSDSALSWEEVNFAEYEEVSDDDLRDAVVVTSRGRTASLTPSNNVCQKIDKICSLSTQESGSLVTTSSRDGSLTPPSPPTSQVQYFDLTQAPVAPQPHVAARIVQAWWRTLRCPTSIHLPDADEEEDIEIVDTGLQEVALSNKNQGVALRVGSANQWDLWERQMEEDMPLIWESLDRRWLIYTMLLWLVLTMFSSNPFHFQVVPLALANSSSSGQASKTAAGTSTVQSKPIINASQKLLLLPKHPLPNFAWSLAYPFYPKGNSSWKTPQTALVIKVKTNFITSPAHQDAESAWLSEARVRYALSAKVTTKVWVQSKPSELNEPSLWPWSFPSPKAVAGLLPPPKPVKQGTDCKMWWWLLGEKVAGVIIEPSMKLPCSLPSPLNVPLLTWTPKQKIHMLRVVPLLPLIQPDKPVHITFTGGVHMVHTMQPLPLVQPQPRLRIVANLLPVIRPSTSLTTRMFFNQWQPELETPKAWPLALPPLPPSPTYTLPVLRLRLESSSPLILPTSRNVTTKDKADRRINSHGTKRLHKGLRKAKKKAETILEKSRMQALHHLEKARKAFEKKVAFNCLAC